MPDDVPDARELDHAIAEHEELIKQQQAVLEQLYALRDADDTPEQRRYRGTADAQARRRRMRALAWIGVGSLGALWHGLRTHPAAMTAVAAGSLAGVVTITAVVARHSMPPPQARPPVVVTATEAPRPAPTVTTTVTPSSAPTALPTPTPMPTSAPTPTATMSLPESAPPPTPDMPMGDDSTKPPRRGSRRRPAPGPPGTPPTPPGRTMRGPAAPVCALGVNLELAPVIGLMLCAGPRP